MAALLLDVADGGLIARSLVGAFSTNKHWDKEKLLRSQSTIRYLENSEKGLSRGQGHYLRFLEEHSS